MTNSHLMVDLETLGHQSNSVILSIGAVHFNLEGEILNKFHVHIDVQSCIDMGLRCSGSTIMWWLERDSDAVEAQTNAKRIELVDALLAFNTFCFKYLDSTTLFWGNGARFDLGILRDAYEVSGFNSTKIPWTSWQEADLRTIAHLDPESKEQVVKNWKGTTHDALDDCEKQVAYLVQSLKKLNA